ncbi:MAG: hypothetical protein U1E65_29075 [Myxococcota bacterium]
MNKLLSYSMIAASFLLSAQAFADPPQTVITQCTTRTVNTNFTGNNWMAQPVCAANEIAIAGGGFCSQAGQMIGASTTNGKADRDIWLWCTKAGPAVWYGTCCQTAQVATPPPPKTVHNCTTRTVNESISGPNWVGKQVCQANEVAISAGGFCPKNGQMVGVSTTNGKTDGQVWLQCTASGPAIWYGVCCQQ